MLSLRAQYVHNIINLSLHLLDLTGEQKYCTVLYLFHFRKKKKISSHQNIHCTMQRVFSLVILTLLFKPDLTAAAALGFTPSELRQHPPTTAHLNSH